MLFNHVILVGVGGTGSHLVEPLVRLMMYHEQGTKSITIIDGDAYEEKNQTRQLFNKGLEGQNKAEATAKRLDFAPIQVIPKYVNKRAFGKVLQDLAERHEPLLVITAVDNHATRNAVIKVLDESYDNFVLLSPGNDYSHGQVVVYAVKDGKQLTTHPFKKYNDLAFPTDTVPGTGCAEEAPSTPQLITANAAAALAALWTVSAMLDGNPWYEEVHFDCVKMKLVPQGTPVEVTNIEAPKIDKIVENTEATEATTTV